MLALGISIPIDRPAIMVSVAATLIRRVIVGFSFAPLGQGLSKQLFCRASSGGLTVHKADLRISLKPVLLCFYDSERF